MSSEKFYSKTEKRKGDSSYALRKKKEEENEEQELIVSKQEIGKCIDIFEESYKQIEECLEILSLVNKPVINTSQALDNLYCTCTNMAYPSKTFSAIIKMLLLVEPLGKCDEDVLTCADYIDFEDSVSKKLEETHGMLMFTCAKHMYMLHSSRVCKVAGVVRFNPDDVLYMTISDSGNELFGVLLLPLIERLREGSV